MMLGWGDNLLIDLLTELTASLTPLKLLFLKLLTTTATLGLLCWLG